MAGFSWAEASAGKPDRVVQSERKFVEAFKAMFKPSSTEEFKRAYEEGFRSRPEYAASFDPTAEERDAMEAADRAAREKAQRECAHDFQGMSCVKCGVSARKANEWRRAGTHTENVIVGNQLSQDDVQVWGLDVTEMLLDITEHVPAKPGVRTLRLVWICKETTPDGLPGTILNTPFEISAGAPPFEHADAHRERIRVKFEQLYKL